jgi:pimeloyl-ACP methyl ester carboxylesterase
MTSTSSPQPTPDGPGSVSGAPHLPVRLLAHRQANAMKLAADNVEALVIPACGHFVAEDAPDEVITALTSFLAS